MRNFDNKEIATWIENSVKELITYQKELIASQQGCGTLKLDDHLAICIGWSAGYGEKNVTTLFKQKMNPITQFASD